MLTSLRRGQGRLARAHRRASPGCTSTARASTSPASTRRTAPARVDAPTYPFERRSFWITPGEPGMRPPRKRRPRAASVARLAAADGRADLRAHATPDAPGISRRAPSAWRGARGRPGLPGDGPVVRSRRAWALAPSRDGGFRDPRTARAVRRGARGADAPAGRTRRFDERGPVLRPQPRGRRQRRMAAARERPAVAAVARASPADNAADRLDVCRRVLRDYYTQLARVGHRARGRRSAVCAAAHRATASRRADRSCPSSARRRGRVGSPCAARRRAAGGRPRGAASRRHGHLSLHRRRPRRSGCFRCRRSSSCDVRLRDADESTPAAVAGGRDAPRRSTVSVVGEIAGVCLRRAPREALQRAAGARRDGRTVLPRGMGGRPGDACRQRGALVGFERVSAAAAHDRFESLATAHGLCDLRGAAARARSHQRRRT